MSATCPVVEERAAAAQLRHLERARKAAAEKRKADARAKPQRVKELDAELKELGARWKALPPYPAAREERAELRATIREVNAERHRLAYAE